MTLVFKQRASTAVDVVRFDGAVVKGREARSLIAARMGCPENEIDIYRDDRLIGNDEELRTRTEVIVQRHAAQQMRGQGYKKPSNKDQQSMMASSGATLVGSAPTASASAAAASAASQKFFSGMAFNNNSEMTEEERIMALSKDISLETNQTSSALARGQAGGGGRGGRGGGGGGAPDRPPPPNYVCYACGKKGHYIEHCPESNRFDGKRFGAPVGIAESQLERVSESDPGAKFITKEGHWVRRKVEMGSFSSVLAARTIAASGQQQEEEQGEGGAESAPAEEDLLCVKCRKLPVLDGVLVTPCCARPMCPACLELVVEDADKDDEPPKCPYCRENKKKGDDDEEEEVLMCDDVVPLSSAASTDAKLQELWDRLKAHWSLKRAGSAAAVGMKRPRDE